MKLTHRGRVVVYFVAVTALLLLIQYLDRHTRTTTCGKIPEGWACRSTWKW